MMRSGIELEADATDLADAVAECADRAAHELRGLLQPWAWESTRRYAIASWKRALAERMAEEETGVLGIAGQSVAVNWSQATESQRADALRYTGAFHRNLRSLADKSYTDFLRFCDDLSARYRSGETTQQAVA